MSTIIPAYAGRFRVVPQALRFSVCATASGRVSDQGLVVQFLRGCCRNTLLGIPRAPPQTAGAFYPSWTRCDKYGCLECRRRHDAEKAAAWRASVLARSTASGRNSAEPRLGRGFSLGPTPEWWGGGPEGFFLDKVYFF